MKLGAAAALICLSAIGVCHAQTPSYLGSAPELLPPPLPLTSEDALHPQPVITSADCKLRASATELVKAFENAETNGFEDYTGNCVVVNGKITSVSAEDSPWLGTETPEDVAFVKAGNYSLYFVFSKFDGGGLKGSLNSEATRIQGWCFGRQTWYGEMEEPKEKVRRIVFRDCKLLLPATKSESPELGKAQAALTQAKATQKANAASALKSKRDSVRIAGDLLELDPENGEAISELVERFKDTESRAVAHLEILKSFTKSSRRMIEALAPLLKDSALKEPTIELLSKINP